MAAQVAERDLQKEREADDRDEDVHDFVAEAGEAGAAGEAANVIGARAEPIAIAEAPVPAPQPMQIDEETPAAPPAADAISRQRAEQTADATRKTRADGRRATAPPPAPVPPPAMAPAPAPATPAETVTVTASAPTLVSAAYASELSLAAEVRGVRHLRRSEGVPGDEDDARERAASAGIQRQCRRAGELLRRSAGACAAAESRWKWRRRPRPSRPNGDHAMLRFTIDTPRVNVGPRESTPPAATDARIEIEIDPQGGGELPPHRRQRAGRSGVDAAAQPLRDRSL